MTKKPAIVAISGVKNSGKTTLIEALLPHLNAAGLQVAVIKHDGHTFTPDAPDTDTGRHLQAGACGTAIFDGATCQVVRRGGYDERDLIPLFPQADLILLEGFKHSPYPKLEVIRGGNSAQSVCDPATLLGLVTDLPLSHTPRFELNDSAQIAALLLDYANGGDTHD